MGFRYFCDYCNKTFIDDMESRKRHLQSSIHIKLRKQHYDKFNSLKTILKTEAGKVDCQRFFQTGSCQFGSMCKYTHYTQEQLYDIKLRLLEEAQLKKMKSQTTLDPMLLDSWLEAYNSKPKKEEKVGKPETIDSFWTYPERFFLKSDLPPSLKPFDSEQFTDSDFLEWGGEME